MVNTLALGASAVKRLGVQVSPWARKSSLCTSGYEVTWEMYPDTQ